jgi:putative ABC transport system ATP-binding protein
MDTETGIAGSQPGSSAARATGLSKTYGAGEVMGPSGSGKSTLMHCMAGLDKPTSGRSYIGEQELSSLDDTGLTELRRARVGFIFQSFNLVPTLTAAENITLPTDLAGKEIDKQWFGELITQLRVQDRLTHLPRELSGGQQQRIACARALLSRPELIFADEPTGNLDSNASTEVLTFLRRAVDDHKQSIVMVTHDPRAASYADRVVFLADGEIAGELQRPSTDTVLEYLKQIGD